MGGGGPARAAAPLGAGDPEAGPEASLPAGGGDPDPSRGRGRTAGHRREVDPRVDPSLRISESLNQSPDRRYYTSILIIFG